MLIKCTPTPLFCLYNQGVYLIFQISQETFSYAVLGVVTLEPSKEYSCPLLTFTVVRVDKDDSIKRLQQQQKQHKGSPGVAGCH